MCRLDDIGKNAADDDFLGFLISVRMVSSVSRIT